MQIVGIITAVGGVIVLVIGIGNWVDTKRLIGKVNGIQEKYNLPSSPERLAALKKQEDKKRTAQILTFVGGAAIATSIGIFTTIYIMKKKKVK